MLAKNEILENRYKIVRQLGQGGMGAVYEAEDIKRFGKRIALKEILIDAGEETNLLRREFLKRAFKTEAQILASLEHECFPQVIDYFVESERQFLVMELVQGENLSKLLDNRQTAFSTDEVLDWAQQLLDALDYLHTLPRPVFHRDIKPQNLKLTKRGRIKLLDFGIAKASDAGNNLTLTNQTFIAATLHYSPLEQIVKAVDANYREFLLQKFGEKFEKTLARKTDARSDIYALGATIYHLLTNTLPIDSLKRALKVFGGEADELPNPQELNPQIPAAISEWILRAMQIESEDRFADANEMLAALTDILDAEKFRRERELLREEYLRLEAEKSNFENSELLDESEKVDEFFFDDTEIENFIDKTFTEDATSNNLLTQTAVEYKFGTKSESLNEGNTLPMIKRSSSSNSVKLSRVATIGAIILLVFAALGTLVAANVVNFDSEKVEISAVVIEEQKVTAPIEKAEEIPTQTAIVTPTETDLPKPKEVKKVQPTSTPIVVQKPKKDKPKKQNKPNPVTVDDIINDN